MSTSKKEVTSQDVAETKSADPKTHKASNRPVWSLTVGRVECSIFEFDHDGKVSQSIGFTRSYFDKKANAMKRVPYYDRPDLADLKAALKAAEEYFHGKDAEEGD
jgi:hypothetical protein